MGTLLHRQAGPARPPLPAGVIEYWHADYGVTLVGGQVDSWTGQLRGTVLSTVSASLRPAYGPDGSYFKGRPVVQPHSSQQRGLKSAVLASALIATNSRPHTFLIIRNRDTSIDYQKLFKYVNAANNSVQEDAEIGGGTAHNITGLGTGGKPQLASTSIYRLEFFIQAASPYAGCTRINSTLYAGGSGYVLNQDVRIVCVGAPHAGVQGFDVYASGSYALIVLSAAEPTAGELAALYAYGATEWGSPP